MGIKPIAPHQLFREMPATTITPPTTTRTTLSAEPMFLVMFQFLCNYAVLYKLDASYHWQDSAGTGDAVAGFQAPTGQQCPRQSLVHDACRTGCPVDRACEVSI